MADVSVVFAASWRRGRSRAGARGCLERGLAREVYQLMLAGVPAVLGGWLADGVG
jgi:hypothetical protein